MPDAGPGLGARRRRARRLRGAALVAVLAMSGATAGRQAPRVLYLTETAAFQHEVLPLSETVMGELARESGAFEVTVASPVASWPPDLLAQFDVIAFYTTGELPMSEAQQAALLRFVRDGGGFVGIHSATDTFYAWPEYGEMLGGYFDGHPWMGPVRVRVEDRRHPATRHLGPSFAIDDEIYQLRAWSRSRVHVLLSLDTASVDMSSDAIRRTDGDFALAWTRAYGRGRVFYTALGHRPEVWRDARFRAHLIGGITWAAGS